MMVKLFNVCGVVAMAGTLVYAQDAQSPAPRPAPPAPGAAQTQQQDQSITGCLVQGSGPNVFLLENAKLSTDAGSIPASNSERVTSVPGAAHTYVVTAASSAADLKSQLNKQVTIIGTIPAVAPGSSSSSQPAPAAPAGQSASGQRMNEQNLPRITARSVIKVADTCAG